MLDWILSQVANFINTITGVTNSINETVATVKSAEFINSSVFIQYIGAIHYTAGDIIFYECVSLLFLGLGITFLKLAIAILRILKDIKQTALF